MASAGSRACDPPIIAVPSRHDGLPRAAIWAGWGRRVPAGHDRMVSSRCAGVATLRGAACLTAVYFVAVSCRERPVPSVDPGAADSMILGAPQLSVGDLAPEFSLPGSDGKVHKLANYRGRQAVMLAWFSKAFTGG